MTDIQKPHAIVFALDSMTGLQTARILARRGIPVIAIAKDPRHPCCRTRVCDRILTADTASVELIHALESLGPTLGRKAVLYPCDDMSVLLVSRHRERLVDWFHVALPAPDVVETLMDKRRFYAFARETGLPVPGTFYLHGEPDAKDAARELTFPCIVKPPIKTLQWQRHTTAKVLRAADADELVRLYRKCAGWAELLMAQEWIEGPDASLYSCNCYFDGKGEPLVTFVARKLRQWPPEIGTSCLGEECRNDVVLETSLRLFRSANYRGLGYVEMKRDERTGRHYIIEPNVGRPTGRSAIAEAGGVELLYTMYCDAVGSPLPENRQQKYGNAKWIYFRRDVQSAFHYWRRGKLSVAEWWRSVRGCRWDALFSWKDPAPFCYDLLKAARFYRKRVAREPQWPE